MNSLEKKPFQHFSFVSIIIPTKNEAANIENCLRSISMCNHPKDRYEVIVIDNGSTDTTIKILKNWNVTVYILKKATISKLRNFGVQKAKGNIVAFLDADCVVSKNWLKNALCFKKDNCVAWGSRPVVEDDATWVQKAWIFSTTTSVDEKVVRWLPSMNLFVYKSFFLKINGFSESLITCEDVDFCYRLNAHGIILSDRKIKAFHRGEAKTLKEFFHKELWRGKSNYHGIFKHGIVLDELPTLLMPPYVLSCYLMIFGAIFYVQLDFFFLSLLCIILPAIALSLKKSFSKSQFHFFFKLILLYLIYFNARTLTFFLNIRHRSEKKANT